MKDFNYKVSTNICPFCGGSFATDEEEKVVYCPNCAEKGHTVQFKYKKDPKKAFEYANTRKGENELLEKLQDLYAYVKQLGIESESLDEITEASENELPKNGWIITEEAMPMPCTTPHNEIYEELLTDKTIDVSDRQAVCNSLHCINITYILKILDIYIPERYNAKQKDVLAKICMKYPKDTKIEVEYTSKSSSKSFKTCNGVSEFLLFLDTI